MAEEVQRTKEEASHPVWRGGSLGTSPSKGGKYKPERGERAAVSAAGAAAAVKVTVQETEEVAVAESTEFPKFTELTA